MKTQTISMAFKPEFSPPHGWGLYGLSLIALLVVMVWVGKKMKPHSAQKGDCQLLEKKYLGNKTVVYVIEYQQQRYLLADNQQALALHLVKSQLDS